MSHRGRFVKEIKTTVSCYRVSLDESHIIK